jgi:hypothetical protein
MSPGFWCCRVVAALVLRGVLAAVAVGLPEFVVAVFVVLDLEVAGASGRAGSAP